MSHKLSRKEKSRSEREKKKKKDTSYLGVHMYFFVCGLNYFRSKKGFSKRTGFIGPIRDQTDCFLNEKLNQY